MVNDAPTFKRGRAESRGRYRQLLKRNSHIIVTVTDSDAPIVVESKSAYQADRVKTKAKLKSDALAKVKKAKVTKKAKTIIPKPKKKINGK